MSSNRLRQQFKGQLYKYTNVVKGWQYRWFILDPETGYLDYYVSDTQPQRKQRPRGSVHLAAAVISPSDEDSSTFTVNSASGEVFKLQAADARERQDWVNRLRAVAEMHTLAIAQSNPPLPPREHHSVVPPPHSAAVSAALPGSRIHCTLAVLDAFSTARENLQKAELSNQALARVIDNLPTSGPGISNVDPELLLLKATSQATIVCLSHCLAILQQQQIAPLPPPIPRSLIPQMTPSAKKSPLPQQNFTADRKSSEMLGVGDATSEGANPAYLPFFAEHVTPDLEVSDSDEGSDTVSDYEEHSTLLRLASHLKRGTDLTRTTLPTFLMEPRSLLEMLADFWGHTDLFLKIADGTTSTDRMRLLMEWYLTAFHIGLRLRPGKKPFSPLLGEIFRCSWKVPQPDNTHVFVSFIAEQISCHPPVTAFYVECAAKKLSASGSLTPRSIFTGMSIDVTLGGGLSVRVDQERYEFCLPTVHARSIISKPWVQLGGKVTVSCTSGASASISHPKSFFGDKPHQIIGEIRDSSGSQVCKIQGDWNSSIKFSVAGRASTSLEVNELRVLTKRVRHLEKQALFESRRLWQDVNRALRQGHVAAADSFRRKILEQQRAELNRQFQEGGSPRPPIYFTFLEESNTWINKQSLQ